MKPSVNVWSVLGAAGLALSAAACGSGSSPLGASAAASEDRVTVASFRAPTVRATPNPGPTADPGPVPTPQPPADPGPVPNPSPMPNPGPVPTPAPDPDRVPPPPLPSETVELAGIIKSIGRMELNVSGELVTVTRGTAILDGEGNRVGFDQLRVRQRVFVTGFRDADNGVIATRIQIKD